MHVTLSRIQIEAWHCIEAYNRSRSADNSRAIFPINCDAINSDILLIVGFFAFASTFYDRFECVSHSDPFSCVYGRRWLVWERIRKGWNVLHINYVSWRLPPELAIAPLHPASDGNNKSCEQCINDLAKPSWFRLRSGQNIARDRLNSLLHRLWQLKAHAFLCVFGWSVLVWSALLPRYFYLLRNGRAGNFHSSRPSPWLAPITANPRRRLHTVHLSGDAFIII